MSLTDEEIEQACLIVSSPYEWGKNHIGEFRSVSEHTQRDTLKKVGERLIEKKRELTKKKEQQKINKPSDTQSQISLGGRIKGLQQAIDIIMQLSGEQPKEEIQSRSVQKRLALQKGETDFTKQKKIAEILECYDIEYQKCERIAQAILEKLPELKKKDKFICVKRQDSCPDKCKHKYVHEYNRCFDYFSCLSGNETYQCLTLESFMVEHFSRGHYTGDSGKFHYENAPRGR